MRTVKIFTIIFIIVTAASWFLPWSGLWGLASWLSVSVTFGFILALFTLLMMNNTLTDRMASWASWWAEKKWFDLLVFAAALLLFYLFRSRHDLWGERLQVAAATGAGQYFHPNAPLGMLIGRGFHWIMSNIFLLGASASTSLLSGITGGFYILASLSAARTILSDEKGEGGTDRTLIFLGGAKLLFFGGFIVIFFGAGGNTPLATLFALLFIVQAVRFVREETSLLTPTFLFLLAVLSHLSAVYLLPAMIYLVILSIVRKGKRAEGINALFVLIGCWIVIEVVIRVYVGVMGPSQYLAGRIAATFGGVSGVSLPSRLRDSLNALLLTGPVVIAAMIFRIRSLRWESGLDDRTRLERNLFGLVIASAFLLFLATGWRIDGGLRYHIVAPAGPAFTICLLWVLRRTIPDKSELRKILTILIALAA